MGCSKSKMVENPSLSSPPSRKASQESLPKGSLSPSPNPPSPPYAPVASSPSAGEERVEVE